MGTRDFGKGHQLKKFVVASCVAALSLLLLTGGAQAARVHSLQLEETLPENRKPFSVAVNQTTHRFYLLGFGDPDSIFSYEESGDLVADEPKLVMPGLAPLTVAVDNSSGATEGYAYVADVRGQVQQFDASGTATAVTITGASVPANGTPQGGGLPPVVNTSAFQPRFVAVDGSGNLFVVDTSSASAIDKFAADGSFIAQLAAGEVYAPQGVAADSAGDLFVGIANSAGKGLGNGLFKLSGTTGECVPAGCVPIDPTPTYGVAVDNSRDKIFSTGPAGALKEGQQVEEGAFREYDAATGTLLGVTHPAALLNPWGIAVEEDSGKVIVADLLPDHEATVKIFGPVSIVPDVETEAPEAVTDGSATLQGQIGGAEVVPGATCVFQYVTDEGFKANGFQSAAEAPCEPAGPFTGSTMQAVHVDLTGLRGGTIYHERLLGTNANGSNPGEDIPFTTDGPSVSGTEVAEVGESAATLKGLVDPNGIATTYRFQYLTQTAVEANPLGEPFAGASEAPVGGVSIGAGTSAVKVSQRIEGLQPGTAYRFRLLAESSGAPSAGKTEGDDHGFTTFASAALGLPDGRRYEQASPMDKNGANIEAEINSVQASPAGDRITFFSSSGIPGGEGAQFLPSYLATRAPDGSGWSTQGLLPPASAASQARIVGWTEDISETYASASPVSGPTRLLARSSDGGPLTVVGTLDKPRQGGIAFAGASAGGGVALVETVSGPAVFPGGLSGKQNVYAFDRATGTLTVAGVMNDGTVPAGGAMGGPYAWSEGGSPSSGIGGAVGEYFTQALHAISTDGTKAFFTAGVTGQLYVRLNPVAPQSAMSGEECTEAAKACTVRISAPQGVADPETPAAFLGASANGNLVYFLDKGKLTADATGGTGYDLYRYDLSTRQLTALSLDSADKNGARIEGMLGVSESGQDAYFVAAGALALDATQAPSGQTNLYALHGSTIAFIARLGTGGDERLNWNPRSRAGSLFAARASRLSADGQTLLFRSARQLTPYANHGQPELYLYRVGADISCVSCNPSGAAPTGKAGLQEIPSKALSPKLTFAILPRNLSADGQRVIFDSTDRLAAADRNDVNDVYEWEAPGKGGCSESSSAFSRQDGGCLYLLSGGAEGAEPSYFGDADLEGENAFFFTSDRLVAQDRDGLIDAYDARVGGGIAAQEAVPAVPCEGEAGCLQAPSSPPLTSSPGSVSFQGTGNPKPHKKPRCKKGQVRKHGKCVQKRHGKKRHHKHGNGGNR